MPNGGTLEQAKQIEDIMRKELAWLWPVGILTFAAIVAVILAMVVPRHRQGLVGAWVAAALLAAALSAMWVWLDRGFMTVMEETIIFTVSGAAMLYGLSWWFGMAGTTNLARTVISLYYYLRVIAPAVLDSPATDVDERRRPSGGVLHQLSRSPQLRPWRSASPPSRCCGSPTGRRCSADATGVLELRSTGSDLPAPSTHSASHRPVGGLSVRLDERLDLGLGPRLPIHRPRGEAHGR